MSASEGMTRSIDVHWNSPGGWVTESLQAARGVMEWMFGVPLQVDGRRGLDLVAAGKGPDASIGWFEAPADARDLSAWRWHPIRQVGWVMSVEVVDMDGDGDLDVVTCEERDGLGVVWYENPRRR